jgi:serine/threonine protein kinase
MREAACYQALPQHFCFPTLIDEFRTGQGQAALVLSCITGSIDLLELTRQYRGEHHTPGLPQEHLVWILDRFLAALGLLHAQNILHGNIQPDNLLVQPKNHNGVLIDFLHCRIQPAPDEVFDLTNLAYCAPELLSRRFKPHPVSDIYALGCCMLELIGGSADGLDDSIDLHPLLRAFLAKMVNPDPTQRAADAWALAAELKNLRQWLYGAHPQFIPLELGGSYGRR